MIVVEGTILLVKSLVRYPKKSCRGWGKIRVALLRCDNQRLAGSYDPRKRVGTTPWIGVVVGYPIFLQKQKMTMQ